MTLHQVEHLSVRHALATHHIQSRSIVNKAVVFSTFSCIMNLCYNFRAISIKAGVGVVWKHSR